MLFALQSPAEPLHLALLPPELLLESRNLLQKTSPSGARPGSTDCADTARSAGRDTPRPRGRPCQGWSGPPTGAPSPTAPDQPGPRPRGWPHTLGGLPVSPCENQGLGVIEGLTQTERRRDRSQRPATTRRHDADEEQHTTGPRRGRHTAPMRLCRCVAIDRSALNRLHLHQLRRAEGLLRRATATWQRKSSPEVLSHGRWRSSWFVRAGVLRSANSILAE